jgi:regulatory protein
VKRHGGFDPPPEPPRRAKGRAAGHGVDAATERSDDVEAAREAALKLLERTRRTRSDLARRLKEKGFGASATQTVLERLASVGLVDDLEYARAWLAGRWGRRPSGWRRLQQELLQRGISTTDIAAARERLEGERGETDEVASARRVIAQAERRYRSLAPRVRDQRLYALLARRGFDSDTIRAALAAERKAIAEGD